MSSIAARYMTYGNSYSFDDAETAVGSRGVVHVTAVERDGAEIIVTGDYVRLGEETHTGTGSFDPDEQVVRIY